MKNLDAIKNLIFKTSISNSLKLSQALIKDINNSDYYKVNITDIELALIDKVSSSMKDNLHKECLVTKDILFVISEGYATGGHTRLMEHLSRMLSVSCPLLITRPTDSAVVGKFTQYFSTIINCFNNGDELTYIQQIACNMQAYKKVILNTHPDDIHTVIACALAKKLNSSLQIYFVNHADHLASYGVTVTDVWFEISLYGQQLDKDRGLSLNTKTSFLGIPINREEKEFFQPISYNYNSQGFSFLTAATAYKYDTINGDSIEPLARRILSLNNYNQMTFVGLKIDINPIFLSLKEEYPERLHFFSSLPHHDYLFLTQSADFYIDSYPLPGGTAFVEQFISGKPCIGLHTSFYGYTPLEMIKRTTVDEVVELLIQNTPTENFIKDLQLKVYEVHGLKKVGNRFLGTLYNDVCYDNPMASYIQQTPVKKSDQLSISSATIKKTFAIDKKVFFKLLASKVFVKN